MSSTGRTVSMRAAIYARFSIEKQSEHSIADQIRVCERLAERCGFEVVERYSDAAVSGGTANRVGYQRLLDAARHREVDVIVAEDTSRLWRLLAEQAPRLAELRDLGVHVVTTTSIRARTTQASLAPSTVPCPSSIARRLLAALGAAWRAARGRDRRPAVGRTAT
jgi:DNA invertase Pin-like site-specific DNA recombinase